MTQNKINKYTSANFAPSLYFTGRLSSSSHRSVLFPTSAITQSSSAASYKNNILKTNVCFILIKHT
jgi:hypothetical protein